MRLKKSIIISNSNSKKTVQTIDNKDVEFITTDIPEFMRDMKAKGVKRLWLMGGAQLAESFYGHGFIEEYNLFMMPKKIGQGIALLPEILEGQGMALVDEINWFAGITQKNYEKINF